MFGNIWWKEGIGEAEGGRWMVDAGYWILDTGCLELRTLQLATNLKLETGWWILDTGYWKFRT